MFNYLFLEVRKLLEVTSFFSIPITSFTESCGRTCLPSWVSLVWKISTGDLVKSLGHQQCILWEGAVARGRQAYLCVPVPEGAAGGPLR